MASEELEKAAAKYATDAIRLDNQGLRGMAVAKYQKAVDILLKLCSLYPNSPQNRIYMERAESYRNRAKELQGQVTHLEASRTVSAVHPARFEELILSEKPAVTWDDVANLEDAKKAVEESIIYPVRRPDLFPLGWPRGILFFGPPGCGKTLLAAAVAREIDANFYCVDASSIMSKWLGESEKNVSQLFHHARDALRSGRPSIIFLDEIDSLVGTRTTEVGGEVRTRNQFLKEMDGLADKNRSLHVYVIGATNKPWTLDEPFIRRFQKRICIPLPDTEARIEMFKICARGLRLSPDTSFDEIAKLTEGYTGSDVRDIFQSAQMKVVGEFFRFGNPDDKDDSPRYISMADFRQVLAERRPSVSSEMIKNYEKWSEAFKGL